MTIYNLFTYSLKKVFKILFSLPFSTFGEIFPKVCNIWTEKTGKMQCIRFNFFVEEKKNEYKKETKRKKNKVRRVQSSERKKPVM